MLIASVCVCVMDVSVCWCEPHSYTHTHSRSVCHMKCVTSQNECGCVCVCVERRLSKFILEAFRFWACMCVCELPDMRCVCACVRVTAMRAFSKAGIEIEVNLISNKCTYNSFPYNSNSESKTSSICSKY